MKLYLSSLELQSKQENDVIPFHDITYFYGKMGAGKTSIARLIDYCLGGTLDFSPALQSEFVAAKLNLSVNGNPLSLERVRDSEKVVASWTKGEEKIEIVIPARRAEGEVIPGSGIEILSDLLFYLADIQPPKVRRSKQKEEYELERLSIRNLLWYCYLDQDSMDSSFFYLDPEAAFYNRNASKDVLRYVIGFHQEQVAELETELQRVHEERMAVQAGAESLKKALESEGIADKKDIEATIIDLQEELTKVQEVITASRKERLQNVPHIVDTYRQKARQLVSELESVEDAISSVDSTIEDDKRHLNELTMLKVKFKRISSAKAILIGVDFKTCPRCSQTLPVHQPEDCPVCGQPEPVEPQYEIKEEVIDTDATNRINELKEIISLHSTQLKKLRIRQKELSEEKQKTDKLIDEALNLYDSSYLSSTLECERRKAELEQTILKLRDYCRLSSRVGDLKKTVEELEAHEIGLRRSLKEMRAAAEEDPINLRRLEVLFLDCLIRAKISGFTQGDHVAIEPPNFLPQVISPDVGELSITSFSNLSSGGKKSLFKACFAIAFHRLAVATNAVLPTFMIIDSPMKNISERENQEQFEGFHQMLYELAETELTGTQFILIDKEFYPPAENVNIDFCARHMTPDDSENPPLIRYYRGH
ncbi:MAG: hypothetical protein JW725_02190 [Candidatus Babeliaceae bacterium]|nr:hypothetical protein [Candidatus Babeliaceae bacterium]